jgi:hypothetical protein
LTVRLDVGVRSGLQREQPDLRAVAVGDDEVARLGKRRERVNGDPDVRALGLCGHRVRTTKQRIAAERDDHRLLAIHAVLLSVYAFDRARSDDTRWLQIARTRRSVERVAQDRAGHAVAAASALA